MVKKRASKILGLTCDKKNTLIRLVVALLSVAIGLCATGSSARAGGDVQQAINDSEGGQKVIHLCTQMSLPEQRGAMPLNSKWQAPRTLRVLLVGGSPTVRAKVQELAVQWNQFSGVKIQFVMDGQAEIRVSFTADGTSWSYVGTDTLQIPDEKPTMNFGWLTDTTSDEEFSRVVLHEFGHALGLVHEHQNPAAGIPWDKQKVYDYYWRHTKWTREEVDLNLFQLYKKNTTQFSAFDSQSIMLYAIPARLTTNGYSVSWNRVLSAIDKQFIATAYPRSTMAPLGVRSPERRAAAAHVAETGLEAGRPQERPTIINFDAVDATHGRMVAKSYLAKYGITINEVSASTMIVIASAKTMYDGRTLVPSSPPNVLTQINSNDPVSFTLNLPAPMQTVRFTRPGLVAGQTGIVFPEWRAQALDDKGDVLDDVGEPLGSGPKYYSNVPAQTFTLQGPGIRAVRFNSKNYHFAAFSAVVIDDLTLNPAGARP